MPNPMPGDVHINVPLTNISIAYIQQQMKFIAGQVFPVVPVQKQSNRYFVYEKEDWFRLEAQERAPASESAGGGWRIDNTPNYYCKKYAIHKDIDDDTRANADQPIDMDRDATLYVTQQLLLKREKIFVDNYFVTGIWTDVTGGTDFTKWSDLTNGDPITDVDTYRNNVGALTGYEPNTLVLSPGVFATIKNHPSIIERVKYTQRATITTEILAGLFELDRVLVPKGVINSAAEGLDDTDFIFAEGALLVYAAPNPSIMQPSGGYSFSWVGLLGAGSEGNRIKSIRIDEIESDRIEGELACDLKVVATDLGVFFSDPV